jgi:hypothetical protein
LENYQLDTSGTNYFGGTLGALAYVVQGLSHFPGRKSVVLVSDNLPITSKEALGSGIMRVVKNLTEQANRSSVVIYTIDPRGFPKFGLTADDSQHELAASQIDARMRNRPLTFRASQGGLNYLAAETGGLFIHDTNDLNDGLRRVLEDQSGYYLIGYRPDDSSIDPKSGLRRLHHITLKMVRPGLEVRSRSGFYGASQPEAAPFAAPLSRDEQLLEALTAPFNSGGIRLQLTALFADDSKLGAYVHTLVHVDVRDISFNREPDDRYKATFDIITVAIDDEGKIVQQIGRTHTLRARGQDYERLQREGFVYFVNVPLKKAGGYQLRVALRDAASERVGAAGQFVEVPNIKDGRLALSGLFVNGLNPAGATSPASEQMNKVEASPLSLSKTGRDVFYSASDQEAQAGPAVRRFRQGALVEYGCYIYGAQLDSVSRKPRLQTELRLFREGKPVFTGKVLPFDTEGQRDSKRLVAGGSFRLGTDLPPGDYVLQLVVRDLLAAEGRSISSQWIDFEIAP